MCCLRRERRVAGWPPAPLGLCLCPLDGTGRTSLLGTGNNMCVRRTWRKTGWFTVQSRQHRGTDLGNGLRTHVLFDLQQRPDADGAEARGPVWEEGAVPQVTGRWGACRRSEGKQTGPRDLLEVPAKTAKEGKNSVPQSGAPAVTHVSRQDGRLVREAQGLSPGQDQLTWDV